MASAVPIRSLLMTASAADGTRTFDRGECPQGLKPNYSTHPGTAEAVRFQILRSPRHG